MNHALTSRDTVASAIIDVSLRSARAKSIYIFELGNLNDLMPKLEAEKIRQEFVRHNTPIKQITNLRRFTAWTENAELTQQNLAVKYVPAENFAITSEVLIFDNTVAVYRLEPEPFYFEQDDKSYADMLRSLFMNLWQVGDSLLLSADGSTLTKQYSPISYQFKELPVILYPAKDDGQLEKAFSRSKKGGLEKYVNSILEKDYTYYKDADVILAYVWNQESVPYCDIWKISRNTISDDSGLLYDVRIYADHEVTQDMGVASGNSSIVLTAEEMLLRELVIKDGLSFVAAANRELYPARFPIGYVPDESFYRVTTTPAQ
ncbi:MAG TPA: hypothetical protein VLI05_02765 [Candidatus Saccharimonadia bacterium]|nr:hypothetical protein [Candidatus Saccharimonadia bacterium]